MTCISKTSILPRVFDLYFQNLRFFVSIFPVNGHLPSTKSQQNICPVKMLIHSFTKSQHISYMSNLLTCWRLKCQQISHMDKLLTCCLTKSQHISCMSKLLTCSLTKSQHISRMNNLLTCSAASLKVSISAV